MTAQDRLAAWLLPALVALVYLPSLGYPFQFDDYNVIVDNPAVHSLDAWWRSMPGIRPLLKLSYALNWALAPSPFAFRLVNVALHAANALLVYLLLSELARRRALPPLLPLLVAALFAVHPIQTEAVTYICGRSVSLMAFFYLLSLLAWLVAARTRQPGLKWLSALAFLCAFLTRETAIILPAALWIAAHAGTPAPPLRDIAAPAPSLHAYRWPLGIAIAALAFLLALPDYREFFSVAFAHRAPLDNLALQVDAVYVLTGHLLMPSLMNIDPVLPPSDWTATLAAQAGLLALVAALAALALRRRSFAGFCALWYLLHLAPTNSVVPRLDAFNDRQLYLSAIGAYALLALAACHAAQGLRDRIAAARPQALPLMAYLPLLPFLLVLPAGGLTFARNDVYRNEIVFWKDVTAKSPANARAFNNIGYAYQQAGRHADARAAYLRALALSRGMPTAHWNLQSLPPDGASARPSPAHPSLAR